MAEEKTFLIKIITPERVFYEGTAIMAEFNTSEGEIGVYAGHIPLTVILKPGVLTLTEESGKKKAALHTGFAEILPDQISILAEAAEGLSANIHASLSGVVLEVTDKGARISGRKE